MRTENKFRENGAIGALLDEYEKSISELRVVISSVSEEDLKRIYENDSIDEHCRSMQAILRT